MLADFDLVAAKDVPNISERDQYPRWDDDAVGRDSLVWFNQASMIQAAELGHFSIQTAKKQGLGTATDFCADADKCFTFASLVGH